jgi:hypothetical protein
MEEHKMINLIRSKTLLRSISVLSVICFFFFTSCTDDPPTCVITDPADDAVVLQGASITIEVDADDDDGTLFRKPSVEKVNFLIDDILVTTVTSAPYSYTWNTSGEALGYHTVTTVAIDGGDNKTQAEISILVNDAPSCDISSPANNYDAFMGSEVEISVDADDDIGGLDGVEFYVDGSLKGTDATSPYSYAWSTSGTTIGDHDITAVAVDNYGAETDDDITVNVKECLICGTWEGQYTGYDDNFSEDVTIREKLVINMNTTYNDTLWGKPASYSDYILYEVEIGSWKISDDGTKVQWSPTTLKKVNISNPTAELDSYPAENHQDDIDISGDNWGMKDENLDVDYYLQKQ